MLKIVLPRKYYHDSRDNKQNACSAQSSGVRHDELRVLEHTCHDDHWDAQSETPQSLGQPGLGRLRHVEQHEQVVSQGNCQDRNGSHVQRRVEVCDLSDDWDRFEVFVVKALDFSWELVSVWVVNVRESQCSKHCFNNKNSSTDCETVKDQRVHCFLWPHRLDDSSDRVVYHEDEDSV